jgi:hypothetical protein
MLKYDIITKVRFCPDCDPDIFIKSKNNQRIRKRAKDGRDFIGVDNAGEIIYLTTVSLIAIVFYNLN